MIERLGDLQRVTHRFGKRQRTAAGNEVADVDAFDVLENDVVHAAVFAHVIDARDVLVIEPGGRLGFVLEAAARLFVAGLLVGEHLHGHDPVEHRVHGAKHRTHAAAADERFQLEMPQTLPFQAAPQILGLKILGDLGQQQGRAGGDHRRLFVQRVSVVQLPGR